MVYFLAFLSTFLLSLTSTPFLKQIGYNFKILSKPRSRDIHKEPIPRIGGPAIFGSFLIISIIFFLIEHFTFGGRTLIGLDIRLIGILLGAIVISLSMLIDDLYGLRAWKKLLFQILVSIIVIASGIGIDTLANPFGQPFNLNTVYIPILTLNGVTYHFSLLSDLLTIIWLVGMMNVINFVDGIDGLAAGLSGIASGIIFILSISLAVNQPATALLAIILSGASLGFLVWNFPPAKIFMGDSGSMFLGFILGILPLISGGKLATSFLVLGFPIVDGLFVAASRLFQGKNPMTTPDKTHLHHRFLKAGFTARQAILSMYAIAAIFGWVALRSTTMAKVISACMLIALLAVLSWLLNFRIKRGKI